MTASPRSSGFQALLASALIAVMGAWVSPADAQAFERAAPGVLEPPPADALARIIEAGLVRIAVPEDLPPFGSRGDDGTLQGYDVEVAGLLAQDLGVRLELVPVTSANRVPSLLTRQADLVIANLGVNPQRARAIGFSTPYAPFLSGVYGTSEVDVKGPADLSGKTVAVTKDTLEDLELSRMAPEGVKILRFQDNHATVAAFLSGEAKLIATGNVVAAAIGKEHPDRPIEPKFTIKASPASIGVRRGEIELLNWVNVFVFYRKLSGDLDRLSNEWFGQPLPPLPVM
jgi:polar amino acid transport system substrate-binding protein